MKHASDLSAIYISDESMLKHFEAISKIRYIECPVARFSSTNRLALDI